MADRREEAWPWLVDAGVFAYATWIASVLTRRVPAFSRLFSNLNAQVPVGTSFVIRACAPPVPYIVVGLLGLLLVVKNRAMKSTTARLGTSVLVLLAVSWGSAFVQEALFRPMLDLMELVGK